MSAITFDAVRERARGQWPAILERLGIDPGALRDRHGPCPGCGGKDRFRFDDQDRGCFYCGGGGEPVWGDGFTLIQHVHQWTTREALQRVAEVCGMDGSDPRPITPRRTPSKPPRLPRTAAYALELLRAARTEDAVVGTHPYALSKNITWAAGAGRVIVPKGRIVGNGVDCLVTPIRSMDWRVIAVQAINASGAKQTFGPMGDDGCLILGNTLDRSIPWVIVEGWADAVSLVFHIYKGNAVAVAAFGINRMERIARAVADHYQPDEIVILEDAA